MPSYTVDVPDESEPERGIRVRCEEHGDSTEFSASHRTVAFHCDGCAAEIELTVYDLLEWRDLQEMC